MTPIINNQTSFYDKKLLFFYQPPIRTKMDQTISVYYDNQGVYSEVSEGKHLYTLPVKGYPSALDRFPERLQQFFAATYLTVEKQTAGCYSHVRANLQLKGGGFGQQDILPMYPGYAIGNVITKEAFYIPQKEKERLVLLNQMNEVSKKRSEILELCDSYEKQKSKKQIEGKQAAIDELDIESTLLEQKLSKVSEDLSELLASESVPQETLPIDMSRSKISIQERSFASERMTHLIFIKENIKEKVQFDSVQQRVEEFISRLFSDDAPTSFLSSTTLKGVVKGIHNMLETESCISLVGSFITLSRVRVMDPVVTRYKASISDKFTQHPEKYFVLTEAVLGAVFLGFGRHLSEETVPSQGEESTPALMSRLSMISFISQGAVPKTSQDPHNVNLWSVYTSWKEILERDPHSGYPVGFKVRELKDILAENGVINA